MNERVHAATVLILSFVAALGGMVRYIALVMDAESPAAPRAFLLRMIGTAVVSGFTGLMMALVVSQLTQDLTWQYVAAGVSGYTGPKTLDMLFAYLRARFLPAR